MDDKLELFRDFIKGNGLKSTRQRDDIATWFFGRNGHLSAEQIYREVKEIKPGIGFSTVYRTMKLLCEAGLVQERRFGRDTEALYENLSHHHDHCICNDCGRIIEFEDEKIEALQQLVARRFGFELASHRMELYGVCSQCRGPQEDRARPGAKKKV